MASLLGWGDVVGICEGSIPSGVELRQPMSASIQHSQNFLKDSALVGRLVENAKLDTQLPVIEIGAGRGIITSALSQQGYQVVAYELDEVLYKELSANFKFNNNVRLVGTDFLEAELPRTPYQVFSNIPFTITAQVVKKLLFATNPPINAHIIMQKESAEKFLGKPVAQVNSLLAILLKNQFYGSVGYAFNRSDYFPSPRVDTVLVRFLRRESMLCAPHSQFCDFVAFGFSQFEPTLSLGLRKVIPIDKLNHISKSEIFSLQLKASQLDFEDWAVLFELFKKTGNTQRVAGTFARMVKQQSTIKKIHRTRVDGNWKEK